MPVAFRILPRSGLVYVRFEGRLLIDEIMDAFQEYTRHPDARPAQKQLVDLSRVTSVSWDYVKLMKLQALKALEAISKDPAAKVYFINSDSPSPLPLMHLGDMK